MTVYKHGQRDLCTYKRPLSHSKGTDPPSDVHSYRTLYDMISIQRIIDHGAKDKWNTLLALAENRHS
jgi:hypothetical protein